MFTRLQGDGTSAKEFSILSPPSIGDEKVFLAFQLVLSRRSSAAGDCFMLVLRLLPYYIGASLRDIRRVEKSLRSPALGYIRLLAREDAQRDKSAMVGSHPHNVVHKLSFTSLSWSVAKSPSSSPVTVRHQRARNIHLFSSMRDTNILQLSVISGKNVLETAVVASTIICHSGWRLLNRIFTLGFW
jgi:hypothetical protein